MTKKQLTKKVAVALAVACVTAFSASAFAAPGDAFSDVPSKHWSYSAVQKLAKDGIISADANRFNGDKTVTRYEMAMMVANAMTKLEKADAQQKAIIQQLEAEYQDDLKALGARMDAVEKKAANAEKSAALANAKAKVNFFFDNRIEYTHNSLGTNDAGYLNGGKTNDKDQFMERMRVYMNVPVGDQWEWNSRLVQAKWNFSSPTSETVRFDRFWLTGKNLLGGNIEVGKMQLYPGKGAFYGNTGDTEGIYYTKKLDKLSLRLGNARNTALGATKATDVSFAEMTYRPNNKMDIGMYTLKQNYYYSSTAPAYTLDAKDLNLQVINGAAELSPGLALSFEYARNQAQDAAYKDKTGYFVGIQSKYIATNYMPALYTNMVNPFVQGDHGWGVSYRHMPSGVAGVGNRGAFSWVPLTTDSTGTKWQNTYDGVNAWRFDYVYVPWKNVQWTLTYDHIKPINGNWTNNSIQSTFNFFF